PIKCHTYARVLQVGSWRAMGAAGGLGLGAGAQAVKGGARAGGNGRDDEGPDVGRGDGNIDPIGGLAEGGGALEDVAGGEGCPGKGHLTGRDRADEDGRSGGGGK